MRGARPIPRVTSTRDFERYTITRPTLSSWGTAWQGLVVREFHEPREVATVRLPAVPDIHLVMVTQGAMQFESRELAGPWQAVAIQREDLFLTPGGGEPYEVRWRSQSGEPIHALHMHLSAALFARSAEQLAERDPTRLALKELTGFRDPLLAQLGWALRRALAQPTLGGSLYAECAAQLIAVHLLRHYLTAPIGIGDPTPRLTRRQLACVTDYVLAHLAEPLSLERLAQQVGYSAYHFAQLFRRSAGMSPHQFVLSRRLERAKHLLAHTDLPAGQVALAVGFQSQSHFTQAFRHHVGLTPGQYRRHA